MMPTLYLVFEQENDTDPPYLLYFFDLSAFPECLQTLLIHDLDRFVSLYAQ